ncbi:MAG: DUF1922 domain-containing protein [Candidatus Bathyarchaeia archaeon]
MNTYLIIACPRCGSIRYAKDNQKTAECLKCGYQITLNSLKTRILMRTRNVKEAIEAVKKYKMKLKNMNQYKNNKET